MGQRLINVLREVTPVVIDFEYTTPTGAAPEPIEIAVQALRVRDGTLERTARWEALMRPPRHAELMAFDINQTASPARGQRRRCRHGDSRRQPHCPVKEPRHMPQTGHRRSWATCPDHSPGDLAPAASRAREADTRRLPVPARLRSRSRSTRAGIVSGHDHAAQSARTRSRGLGWLGS